MLPVRVIVQASVSLLLPQMKIVAQQPGTDPNLGCSDLCRSWLGFFSSRHLASGNFKDGS